MQWSPDSWRGYSSHSSGFHPILLHKNAKRKGARLHVDPGQHGPGKVDQTTSSVDGRSQHPLGATGRGCCGPGRTAKTRCINSDQDRLRRGGSCAGAAVSVSVAGNGQSEGSCARLAVSLPRLSCCEPMTDGSTTGSNAASLQRCFARGANRPW